MANSADLGHLASSLQLHDVSVNKNITGPRSLVDRRFDS